MNPLSLPLLTGTSTPAGTGPCAPTPAYMGTSGEDTEPAGNTTLNGKPNLQLPAATKGQDHNMARKALSERDLLPVLIRSSRPNSQASSAIPHQRRSPALLRYRSHIRG